MKPMMLRFIIRIAVVVIGITISSCFHYVHAESVEPLFLNVYRATESGRVEMLQSRIERDSAIAISKRDNRMMLELYDWTSGEHSIPVDSVLYCAHRTLALPAVKVWLDDYPEATTLWEKDLYLNARICIEGNGMVESLDTMALSVKGRGNSTWQMPKKPMRLKFAKKTSIAGMKKAKNFVLLNNYVDPTLMKNVTAMWLAERLGVPYANKMVACHLFLNDHYLGAYTLTHKVGLNSGSVSEIDESKGVLLELSTEFDEKYKFRSIYTDQPVMIKDPDLDEIAAESPDSITPDQLLDIWRHDFNRAERLAMQNRGEEAFDVESVVSYIMLFDICGNEEIGYPKSLYLHKEAPGDSVKYYLGPAWDFDVAFSCPQRPLWLTPWLSRLRDTPGIHARYVERLKEFVNDTYPELIRFINQYSEMITTASELNANRWPEEYKFGGWADVSPSYPSDGHVSRLKEWINRRVEFLSWYYGITSPPGPDRD
ncbi:MAG: CotH kinase family protein [Muribaculaceae bacterium]|nr:CotH kinase family protein [Muribaculaceae bacterium]